jgi:hypothetical protein
VRRSCESGSTRIASIPANLIGSIAMFWVIERISDFAIY